MNKQKLISAATFPALLAIGGFLGAFAPTPVSTIDYHQMLVVADDSTTNLAPDNSIMNSPDQSSQDPTADQAGNKLTDRKIMQRIRKHIVSDSTLSTDAHNIKVISQNGKVTLKGPVNSEQEKRSIVAKAAHVVAARNVTNDLMVKEAN